jgi:subtilisin family serine protease
MRLTAASFIAVAVCCAVPPSGPAAHGLPPPARYSVAYGSDRALERALSRERGLCLRRVDALQIAEVRSAEPGFAARLRELPGIRFVERVRPRRSQVEPALALTPWGAPYEWQFEATHADGVPTAVLQAASSVTIAVIDTGADLGAPDLAAKGPRSYDVRTGSPVVTDTNGHGTFVASLAAGSTTNGEGIAGFGGQARLLVVKVSGSDGTLTDVDEANAIAYAVDHGARVINLSIGGPDTSATERRGVEYAATRGVLLVAAVGNEFGQGNAVEYPAGLLQPVGSNGEGGVGLSVAASTANRERAFFSNTGSHVSLAAPGEQVFGAVASKASEAAYPRMTLPGWNGSYGFASGTSFAAPQVAGAAALVMAANPLLRADEVAGILKDSASGQGVWTPLLGYGILDVAGAVARAQGRPSVSLTGTRVGGRLRLTWVARSSERFRLTVKENGRGTRVIFAKTSRTSTTYPLRPGRRYGFNVTALDDTGTDVATSLYTVRG